MSDQPSRVRLSMGTIEYEDTGGPGPVFVLLHGLIMDGHVWRDVVADLRSGARCITPTLPLGSHRLPMDPDADLSIPGIARIVGEFLDALDLDDVILVVNDIGAPLLVAAQQHPRVGSLVVTPCEAFDNVPPGLPGHLAAWSARVPGGFVLGAYALRMPGGPHLMLTRTGMTKRGVPRDLVRRWTEPARTSARVRGDIVRYCCAVDKDTLLTATLGLASFHRPALVIWPDLPHVMPAWHGPRLAQLLPESRLVGLRDAYVFLPLDQPGEVTRHLREFATFVTRAA